MDGHAEGRKNDGHACQVGLSAWNVLRRPFPWNGVVYTNIPLINDQFRDMNNTEESIARS